MVFLSQLLGKKIYLHNKSAGIIEDLAVFQNRPHPPISKIEIKNKKQKVTVSPHALSFENNKFVLKNNHDPFLPYDHTDFYLSEDLLDKQVIDVTGKRLVRVNDVALEVNGELKVLGIDIGIGGILRRLGFGTLTKLSEIIPWDEIEAFDYQTGSIKIKSAGKIKALHASEIADILEDVGTRERIGLVEALDPREAAEAIEETDDDTQLSILETLPVKGSFKDILNRIRISELADVFSNLNASKKAEVQNALTKERAAEIKSLSNFSHKKAGGLMTPNFIRVNEEETVTDALKKIAESENGIPEVIILVDNKDKFKGLIKTKDFIIDPPETILSNLDLIKISVDAETDFQEILELFSKFNLRGLCVINEDKAPIGIILIDDVISEVAKESEEDEVI